MSTIIVIAQILDGNLGDDWNDTTCAAHELALYTERQWTSDLASYTGAGHEVEFRIDVRSRTSGVGHDLEVIVADDSGPTVEEIERELTDANHIYAKFCCSPEAANL